MKEPKLHHPKAASARPPEQTFRILFVDDAENILQLKEACNDAGYVVVGATTLPEAWAFLDGKNHADVIVCAAHLEHGSVFEFLAAVRGSSEHKETMFLILSLEPGALAARLDKSTERAAMALGADAYVVMPVFDACELISQIRQLQPEVPELQKCATPEEKRRSE